MPRSTQHPIKAHHHPVKLMGCGFVLTAVDRDPQLAWDGIRAGVSEIDRVERLISSWKSDTVTHQINENAGIRPVSTPPELIQLIQRSLRISELTRGAFDISGTLSRYYYQFDKQEHAPLPIHKLAELRDLIDFRAIEVDEGAGTVFLRKKGMKIGFGGIGKGYAAYRAHIVMQQMGIQSGMINASGDLMCWGDPPKAEGWEVYLPDPEDRKSPILFLTIPNGSVVTSGNHENYTLVNGKRLSHIVDPRTALPVEGLQTVSVICPNPEFADALATGISVMGAKAGIELVDHLQGVECVLIDAQNNRYVSKNLQELAA